MTDNEHPADQPYPLPPESELPGLSAEETAQVLRRLLAGLLEWISPVDRRALKLAAIAHWFDDELLTRLGGESFPADQALSALQRFPFFYEIVPFYASLNLTPDAQFKGEASKPDREKRYYRLAPLHRTILLESWQTEDRAEFQQLNRTAWQYFSAQAYNSDPLLQSALQAQAVYHRLVVDEAGGLLDLAASFENTFDRYQLDAAEDLLHLADEPPSHLSFVAQAWLAYFRYRLDLALHPEWTEKQILETQTAMLARALPSESISKDVQASTGIAQQNNFKMQTILKALANWTVGQDFLRRGKFTLAVQSFDTSLSILQSYKVELYLPRLMLSSGDARFNLAQKSGISSQESWQKPGWLDRLLYILGNLPFLLVEGLIRRLSFLPSGWYFGMNYQDWIIALLLADAARWYRRAQASFEAIGDSSGWVRARLAMANTELVKGRWSRAASTYLQLLYQPLVQISQYRTAQFQLGTGRLALARQHPAESAQLLEKASRIFLRFKDLQSYAAASELLGHARARLGSMDLAETAFEDSLHAYQEIEEYLETSAVTWNLQNLQSRLTAADPLWQQIDQAVETQSTLHFLTRFPARYLPRFRRLALTRAIPITYLFVFLVGLGLFQAFAVVETAIGYQQAYQQAMPLRPVDIVVLLLGIFLPVPLSLWIYRLVYSLAGMRAVHRLGHDLANIQEDQPDVIVLTHDNLEIHKYRNETPECLAWSQITGVVSMRYRLWKRTVPLISSLVLLHDGASVRLEGSTLRFEQLVNGIKQRLGSPSMFQNLDFHFLRNRWNYFGFLLSLMYAFLLASLGLHLTGEVNPDTGLQPVPLVFSLLFLVTYLDMLFIYPAITLWRLVVHRRLSYRVLGFSAEVFPNWMLYLAAIVVSLLALGWLTLLPFLPK